MWLVHCRENQCKDEEEENEMPSLKAHNKKLWEPKFSSIFTRLIIYLYEDVQNSKTKG